mmetsp:Transcript_162241/g.515445  ORF Transcript_162241/g.515445 Transcript_162241/m.515445 type:complete len:140 (-) Transcript_162241:95-514(-)
MIPQHIANVVWGIADLRNDALNADFGDDLMALLATETVKKARRWTDRDMALDLPLIAYAFARLKNKQQALLTAIASTLSGRGKLKLTNDWGLCALTWSFTDVFPDAEFSDFRERLRAEVGRRGLSEEMVSRSQFGPDEW